MSRFHGPQPGYKDDRGPNKNNGPKGIMRQWRKKLRKEAEDRQRLYRQQFPDGGPLYVEAQKPLYMAHAA